MHQSNWQVHKRTKRIGWTEKFVPAYKHNLKLLVRNNHLSCMGWFKLNQQCHKLAVLNQLPRETAKFSSLTVLNNNSKHFSILYYLAFHKTTANSRCLEVVGARKNVCVRRRHACLPHAHPLSLVPTTSKRLLHRLTANLPGKQKSRRSCYGKSCTKNWYFILITLECIMYPASKAWIFSFARFCCSQKGLCLNQVLISLF